MEPTRSTFLPLPFEKPNGMAVRVSAGECEPTLPEGTDRTSFAFHGVDFGQTGATGFTAEARVKGAPGWVDIRLDDPAGHRCGVCQAAPRDLGTGSWGTVRAGVYVPAGIHDVYLTFRGFSPGGAALRGIRFTADPAHGLDLGGVRLPQCAPWLGPPECYFIGGGKAGGGGDAKGVWDSLTGPGYTFYGYIKSNESFIRREEIRLALDGREETLDFGMRRVRGTGMFLGTAKAGGIRIHVLDYAARGEPWVTRLVRLENLDASAAHTVELRAVLLPDGESHFIIGGGAVAIAHGCDDRSADKYAVIGFAGAEPTAARTGEGYALSSGRRVLQPSGLQGSACTTALLHAVHREAGDHMRWAESIRDCSEDSLETDAGHCIIEWQAWFSSGDLSCAPEGGRTRDLLEGALASIRMLQGEDGGIMATARSYMDSYIRDSAGAVRGLTAFGFTREAERFLRWAHRKFELHGAIVCDANIGDDANWFPGYGGPDNWAAETPALYLLAARDYFRCMEGKGMEDDARQVLADLEPSLRFAADAQILSLMKNGFRLRFNGDETESGGAGIPLADRPDLNRHWSMPSLALCIPSLEFYMEFLRWRQSDARNYAAGSRQADLHEIAAGAMRAMDDDFWRTDLAEYAGGFYEWYRTEDGGWPTHRITNYSLFPLCYGTAMNFPERAAASVGAMKRHFNAGGYLPIQPGGETEGFCGHNLGYLLQALTLTGDPMADVVFEALTCGGTMGCWGTWSEAYEGDGVTHAIPGGCFGYRVANMRPFETGVNIAAIHDYLNRPGKAPESSKNR